MQLTVNLLVNLLVNSVIVMASQKGSKASFRSNTILLLVEKTRLVVHPWCVRVDLPMDIFEWIIQLLCSLELSENHRFSDHFKGWVELNWFA